MKLYTPSETAALLPYPALVAALKAVLLDGLAFAPERSKLELPDGVLLLMPARDEQLAITKLVSVHMGNTAHNLPIIQGEVIVMQAQTGRRLLMLDGVTVTARRTAAVSLLAAQTLAANTQTPLLIIGAGAQARSHLEAFAVGLGVREVLVHTRSPARVETLLADAERLGVTLHSTNNVPKALEQCALIVTATNATSPVIPDLVRQDAFIAAVGAFRPEMLEIPSTIVHRAALYVDWLEGARHEAGDLLQAGVDWATVKPLAEVLHQTTPNQGLTLFKSVGHALWDLAAARCALQILGGQ